MSLALTLVLCATTAGCAFDAPVVHSVQLPPATQPPTTQPPAPQPPALPPPVNQVAAPAPADPKVLGPEGYGDLTLGTPRADAFARGLLTPADPTLTLPEGCTMHHLPGRPPGPDQVAVYASPRGGVVQIVAAHDWRTPEHIGVGSTLAQVKGVYPDLVEYVNGANAVVPGNPGALYRFMFDQRGVVTDFAIELRGQECTN